jgi:hypothetical protein
MTNKRNWFDTVQKAPKFMPEIKGQVSSANNIDYDRIFFSGEGPLYIL